MNIVEFSKTLNLSIGTVSRALNDRPEVSPRTRQRVLDKAREMGFTPNTNARRLVTGKNFLIRLECPNNTSILSDLFLVQLARAVEEAVGARGYDLLLRLGERHPHQAAEFKAIDGLILVVSPETRPEDIRALTQDGRIPASVICGPEPLDFPCCSYICSDSLPGVREAVGLFAGTGHWRIGYLGSGAPGCRVRAAFPQMVEAAGLEWRESLALDAGLTQADGYRAAMQLLQMPSPPTALFARTDILAIGAVQAAHRLGLTVPGNIAVIGHDDIELASLVTPPLTTVAIDTYHIGKLATAALLDMVECHAPPTRHTANARLVIRQSCEVSRAPHLTVPALPALAVPRS